MWDKGFDLTKADCKLFSMSQIDLIQKERMRLYGTLDNKNDHATRCGIIVENWQIKSRKRTRNAMVAFCTLTFVEASAYTYVENDVSTFTCFNICPIYLSNGTFPSPQRKYSCIHVSPVYFIKSFLNKPSFGYFFDDILISVLRPVKICALILS